MYSVLYVITWREPSVCVNLECFSSIESARWVRLIRMQGLKTAFNLYFHRHLFFVNTTISSSLQGLGDLLQQSLEKKWKNTPDAKHDWNRTRKLIKRNFTLHYSVNSLLAINVPVAFFSLISAMIKWAWLYYSCID